MHSSFPPGTTFGTLLINLHTARRHLLIGIESNKRLGKSTAGLERELYANSGETRAFLAYLQGASGL